MSQKLRGLGGELFIRLFFLLLARRGPPGCRLFLRRGLQFVQSVPRPAFCASLANTRVGSSGTDVELFTSTDVRKTCRSTATLILALLGTSGRWLTGSPLRRAALRARPGPPGGAIMQGCLGRAGRQRRPCAVPKLRINTNKKAKEIAAWTL